MTKLQELQEEIKNSIRSSKVRGINILNGINTEVLASTTIVVVNNATIEFHPFAATACTLGDKVTAGLDIDVVKRFKFGVLLLDALANMEVIKLYKDKKNTPFIEVTDLLKFAELLFDSRSKMKDVSPNISVLPQIEAPLDWRGFRHPVAGKMVRRLDKKQEAYFTKENCPMVFEMLNKAQKVRWNVNKSTLNVYNCIKDTDPLFTKVGKHLTKEQVDSIKSADNAVMDLAETMKDEEWGNYHFPDKRGRLNCTTNHLNYQGSKLSKSMHLYALRMRLGASGWFFLLTTVSSYAGQDKESLESKYEYAIKNLSKWMEIAKDPIKNRDWTKMDEPHAFLAGILEIENALSLENPEDYESGLPVPLDASCSGLMILSALSRDEISAILCNLTGNTLGDYYLKIADKLDAFKDNDFWKNHVNMRRKIVKRCAMVYFYSAGIKCMQNIIYDDWSIEIRGLSRANANELGKQIYKACVELMPGPAALMNMFISKGAEAYNKGEQYQLDLPNGFRMHNNYTKDRSKQIDVTWRGVQVKHRIIVEKGAKIDKKKVDSATAPNVVHAIDAQLVSKAILECDYQVTTIHDSFSTHAATAGMLFEDLRNQFIDFFENLELDGYEFPKGKLDLNDMIDNEYNYA